MTFAKRSALILVLFAAPAVAQDSKKKSEPKPSSPTVDFNEARVRVSNYYGHLIASDLKQKGMDLDIDSFLKAIRDGMTGSKPAYSQAEFEQAMMVWRQELMAKQAAAAKVLSDKNRKEGEAYLAANKTKPGVKTTASGLQYLVVTEGTGKIPKLGDTVSANYKGTFIDGNEFDSSERHGGPQSFPVRGVIRGWTEALQMMKEGTKMKLVIPSDLAYGPEGKQEIPPNAVLLFDIELVKVESSPAAPR